MQSRALRGWAVLMTAYGCALACGGDTSGDASSGRGGGSAETTGGRDSGGGSGGSDSQGSSGSDSGDTGGSPGSGGNESSGSGAAPGGVPAIGGTTGGVTGGVGGTTGIGGSAAVAAGGDFIWSGYDLLGVELDESSSGTPVPEGDPGNDYGRTVVGAEMPLIGLDCPEGGYGLNSDCMEFMVCDHRCDSDEDCPPVDSGTTSPQCRDPFGSDRCSLPCGEGLICPDGMACVYIDSGFFCAWPSPIVMYGCPGYCSELGGPCDSRSTGDCCEGLVCAPWDECEEGTCLRLSWPCSEDTAPCCEGMACIDGYCT